MVTGEPRRIAEVGATLGEGPAWDAPRGVLWFVDIKECRLYRFSPDSGVIDGWDAPAQIGWALPAPDGSLVVGLQGSLARFDPDTGHFEQRLAVEPELPGNRLNDAGVAPNGRLWFGSMDDAEHAATGRLYRVVGGRPSDSGLPPVAITNGPAFSPDGRILYHTDTLGGVIHAVRLDADDSVLSTSVFARIDPADGYPDGTAVDADGCVWTGLFGGWAARRYAPDGALLATVRFPVANVTKIAFGGPDLRTAYATTARKGLNAAARARQPFAGDLFAFDAGVAGLPPVLISASP